MKRIFVLLIGVLALTFIFYKAKSSDSKKEKPMKTEIAVFGGGCFWCMEAVFERIEGIIDVQSGYAGGNTKDPSYKEVCTGDTMHAEVIRIKYDPKLISFSDLLDIFFAAHDPTTLNRQGADVGTQYRSAIFYQDEAQKKTAKEYIHKLEESKEYSNPIVTQLVPMGEFYLAEDYHQNYYDNHTSQPYCSAVIAPKIKKVEEKFKDRLKKEYRK